MIDKAEVIVDTVYKCKVGRRHRLASRRVDWKAGDDIVGKKERITYAHHTIKRYERSGYR
ncbi:MAG: hypothetical protein ISS55_00090 [Dehalococcoidales bacterium]|nr:hypothetical protein [Dehalococcoidales bacterium]